MAEGGTRRRDAARVLAQLDVDPALHAALAVAYAGRHDLLDALWWAAHPGTSTPAGLPDPSGEIESLRRAVYSRDGQASALVDVVAPTGERVRMREAEARILDCREQLAADAAAVDALLAAAHRIEVDHARAPRGAPIATASAPIAHTAPIAYAAPIAHTAPTTGRAEPTDDLAGAAGARRRLTAAIHLARRRGPAVPAVFASIGLVLGAALTWAVVSGSIGVDGASDGAAPSSAEATGSPRALEVFRRAPADTDRLPDEYFHGSPDVAGRLLYVDDTLRVWAYRDRGEVCLFLQDREAAAGTCTTEEVFATNGITLPLPYHGVSMTSGVDGSLAPALAELRWLSSGEIQIEAISVVR